MFENLYENRAMIGGKLTDILRGRGYTKVSFARMLGIPEIKLKDMLAGKIDSEKEFLILLAKFAEKLDMTISGILMYRKKKEVKERENVPFNLTEKGKNQYECLQGILDLCGVYY